MKTFILFLIFILIMSCTSTNILCLKYKPHYQESNTFKKDSNGIVLLQLIKYNRPKVIDEEFVYSFEMIFKSENDLLNAKKLNLADTDIVKTNFDKSSIWNWSIDSNSVDGIIKVIRMNDDKIFIKERIKIKDYKRSRNYKLKGKIKFMLE